MSPKMHQQVSSSASRANLAGQGIRWTTGDSAPGESCRHRAQVEPDTTAFASSVTTGNGSINIPPSLPRLAATSNSCARYGRWRQDVVRPFQAQIQRCRATASVKRHHAHRQAGACPVRSRDESARKTAQAAAPGSAIAAALTATSSLNVGDGRIDGGNAPASAIYSKPRIG